MSDLVGNPEDWFSYVAAHMSSVSGQDSKGGINMMKYHSPVHRLLNTEVHT